MTSLFSQLFYYDNTHVYSDDMFASMWKDDREQFIRIAFYLRGHNNSFSGNNRIITPRGEHKIFYQIIRWLSYNQLADLILLLPLIPRCGYWKDLLMLLGTPAEPSVLALFVTQLRTDFQNYHGPIRKDISMLAKWIPNEGSSYDRGYNVYGKLTKLMRISRKALRVNYLVPLRRFLNITEQLITDKHWEVISYPQVPARALKLHATIFQSNDKKRYEEFMNKTYITYPWKMFLPKLVTCTLSDIPYDNNREVIINPSLVLAIDISGAMTGFPFTLSKALFAESGAKYWLPYEYVTPFSTGLTGGNGVIEVKETNVLTRTVSFLKFYNNGFDIKDTISAVDKLPMLEDTDKSKHLIILSNFLVNPTEFTMIRRCHVTFWGLKDAPIIIKDYPLLTMIEGYDVNIYHELCKGKILTREKYKELIVSCLTDVSI